MKLRRDAAKNRYRIARLAGGGDPELFANIEKLRRMVTRHRFSVRRDRVQKMARMLAERRPERVDVA